MKINNSDNTALTLIEALIWFAIFAAVIAGVFSLYSNSRSSNNASQINKEMVAIYTQTENLYTGGNTTGLSNILGLQMGIFPKSLKVIDSTNGTINNIYGGVVLLKSDAPTGFNLTYEKIPKGTVCANIIKSQKNTGWDGINGSVIKYDSTYSINSISTICGENGSGNTQLTFEKFNRST